MRRFIFFLFFILSVPIFAFSQTEQQQKSAIRTQSNVSLNSTSSSRTMSSELFDKQTIRNESRRETTVPIVHTNPFWNPWNRWNRWGAPYSFMRYDDFFFFDRFGYRRPARIYYSNNNRIDTVVSRKTKTRLGLNFSSNNQLGGWLTVGRAFYFKGQFQKTLVTDRSEFYTHPDVNFYNATTVWGDQRLSDITKGWSLYLGVGREIKNLGINLSLGIGNETENFQFFDEYYQLSNNGKYSFRNFVDNYVSFSLGITHDYKFLSLNADVDPLRKNILVGVGFNF